MLAANEGHIILHMGSISATLADIGTPLAYSAAMGSLGPQVLARYNAAMDIIVLTNNIALAFSIAQSIGLSKLVGQRDFLGIQRYFFSSMITMLNVCVVTTVAGVVYIYNRDRDALVFPNAIGACLDMMGIYFVTVLRCFNFDKLPHIANGIVATVPWLGVALTYVLREHCMLDEYHISMIYMVTEALSLLPLVLLSCRYADRVLQKSLSGVNDKKNWQKWSSQINQNL